MRIIESQRIHEVSEKRVCFRSCSAAISLPTVVNRDIPNLSLSPSFELSKSPEPQLSNSKSRCADHSLRMSGDSEGGIVGPRLRGGSHLVTQEAGGTTDVVQCVGPCPAHKRQWASTSGWGQKSFGSGIVCDRTWGRAWGRP